MSPCITLHTVEQLLDVLRRFTLGRETLLLGSAPGWPRALPEHDLLASVNGSHAGYGLRHVDILFLNSFSLKLTGKNATLRSRIMEHLSYVSCDLLVIIDAAGIAPLAPVRAQEQIMIDRRERNRLVERCLKVEIGGAAGGDLVPSTGMQAALALRDAGAITRFFGFSLENGHLLDAASERMHLEMDRRVFRGFGI